jgi:hypothetical protein
MPYFLVFGLKKQYVSELLKTNKLQIYYLDVKQQFFRWIAKNGSQVLIFQHSISSSARIRAPSKHFKAYLVSLKTVSKPCHLKQARFPLNSRITPIYEGIFVLDYP